MPGRGTSIGIAVLSFVAGAAAIWFVRSDGGGSSAPTDRVSDHSDVGRVTERLDSIDRRLGEIEASINALDIGDRQSTEAPRSSAEAPVAATRTETTDLEEIRKQLASLREEVLKGMAGLGELQILKPEPDLKALGELRARCGDDAKMASDAVRGLTYRDLVLQFGTPTAKFAQLSGTKSRPEYWRWEAPSGDLVVSFANGVTQSGEMHRSGLKRKWLEKSEKQ